MLIGAIARPHGIKGDVQVVPFNTLSPLWEAGTTLAVTPKESASPNIDVVDLKTPSTLTVKRVSAGPKGRLIVWFDGIAGRSEAEAYKGAWLAVPSEALGELEEGEFWYYEVSGWAVVSSEGEDLGKVVRIIDGATDLLEVRPPQGGDTYYIPMVEAFILEVNRDQGRITVDVVEGLLP